MLRYALYPRKDLRPVVLLSLVVIGLSLCLRYFIHPYTLFVDGQAHQITAIAFTAQELYTRLGIPLAPQDQLSWPAERFSLNLPSTIALERARPVRVISPDGVHDLFSTEIIPANILANLGYYPFPKDLLLRDGHTIDPSQPLTLKQTELLVWQPARHILLMLNGEQKDLYTQATILGDALAEYGIVPGLSDKLIPAADTPVSQGMQVTLNQAQSIQVLLNGSPVSIISPERDAVALLHAAGLAPQGLDQLSPALDSDVLSSISLTRIEERLEFSREETAFKNSYQEDPQGELDTLSVLVPGQVGIVVERTRSQIAAGKILASTSEGPWKASDPADGVLGMGTIPVLKKTVVDGQEIEYWRKVSVYATGYMPKALGGDVHTASGLTLTKGIIAVTVPWYQVMKFQKVYVQGYGFGTIADTGGGIPGTPWIDLGFDDDNYVSWHNWTTMYFLPPIPAWVPVSLP